MMPKPLALIIEDDPQLSQVFCLTLQALFETEAIMDGTLAQERLAEVLPNLIILDLNLPGVSGKAILSKIRVDERLCKVPLIIATADALQADFVRNDSDIILLKPISPLQLRAIAERLQSG
jgi:two-component system alkaline phosphatase synthesis response regulator PhoP